ATGGSAAGLGRAAGHRAVRQAEPGVVRGCAPAVARDRRTDLARVQAPEDNKVDAMSAEASPLSSEAWLVVRDLGDEPVLITAEGNAAASKAYDLWAACERAFETSGGRQVIC